MQITAGETGCLTAMASSGTIVCLLGLLAFSVDAQRPGRGIVSVGSFNTLLIPGSTAVEERKELFLQTVSESAIWLYTCKHANCLPTRCRSTSIIIVNTL